MLFRRKKEEIDISDPLDLKTKLEREFQAYHVRYSATTDIFKISSKKYKHVLWYYPDKASKFQSERRNTYEQTIAILILVCLGIFIKESEHKYEWMQMNIWLQYGILLGLYGIFYLFLMRIKPHYSVDFQQEHERLLSFFESNCSANNDELA